MSWGSISFDENKAIHAIVGFMKFEKIALIIQPKTSWNFEMCDIKIDLDKVLNIWFCILILFFVL